MPYDLPHAVSPSLWVLAWRRLRSDRVAMVSLAIVVAFLIMMLLSATGLIAKDWGVESGINYAPPSFLGDDLERAAAAGDATPAAPKVSDAPTPVDIKDPLADALAEIRGERGTAAAPSTSADGSGVVVPLADVMAEIRAKGAQAATAEVRTKTLPFGGDKWGRDVLKKTIKGSQTSIFVGLAAAIGCRVLETNFGSCPTPPPTNVINP